jgi:hypothetical protein
LTPIHELTSSRLSDYLLVKELGIPMPTTFVVTTVSTSPLPAKGGESYRTIRRCQPVLVNIFRMRKERGFDVWANTEDPYRRCHHRWHPFPVPVLVLCRTPVIRLPERQVPHLFRFRPPSGPTLSGLAGWVRPPGRLTAASGMVRRCIARTANSCFVPPKPRTRSWRVRSSLTRTMGMAAWFRRSWF